MLLIPKLKFVAVAIALMALISSGVWIGRYASAAEQPAAGATAPATSPAPAVASEITVDSDFDCGTPGDAVVDSPNHVTITLQPGPLDWWMFRLKGVAGKTVTIEIMLNPSSARASLKKWSTLTPVYGDAADLSDPATFATGPLDVDVVTDRPGIRNPNTDQQTWHYIKDSSLVDTRHFKMTQTFDLDPVYIAGRIPYPPDYSAKCIDSIAANPLAKVIDLGKTPEDRPIRIVQIGATDNASQASKPGVIICGGEQAYQPDGMWACQGCMEFLLGDSDKAKALRDQCVFFIIPMLDPDGTAHSDGSFIGSFRARRANPTAVAYANWLQSRVLAGGRIDLVLELHSLQSGESEHLQRVEMRGLPPERPALIEAFQRIITRQFTTNKLTVFRANMNAGVHNPYRFSGWVSMRFGALDIIYELNAQAPARHLTLSQLKDTGRLFALAAGEFFDSEYGARLLASVDKARAVRQAVWNGNPSTNPSQNAIESEEPAAERSASGVNAPIRRPGVRSLAAKEVSLRVLSPPGEPIAIDNLNSIFVVMDDGQLWFMGPQPQVRSRSDGGWVGVDGSLFAMGQSESVVKVTIQSAGTAIRATGKLPRGRWSKLELTANGTPDEIGADTSAGPSAVAAGEIAGVVVDPQGQPVAGAVVSFPRPAAFAMMPSTPPVTTGADGLFRFPKSEEPRGMYLQVERAGYSPRWINNAPQGEGFTVHLDNKTHLAGKLTLPDGSPAANAQIDLIAHKASTRYGNEAIDDSIPYAGKADAQGVYDLLLEPGEYDVRVTSMAGFVARYEHVQIVCGQTTAIPSELAAGAKLTMLAISSVTGQPVADVHFYQEEESSWVISAKAGTERVTDARGLAKWDTLMPGPAQFGVQADGFGRWWILEQNPSGRRGYTRGIDPLQLNLAVGMPMVTVVFEPAVCVTGQVLSPTGELVAGAVVDIGRLWTGDSRYATRTDKQGRFTINFPDLPAGPAGPPKGTKEADYAVIAYDPQCRWANAISEEFNPNPGDKKSFVLHMTAGGRMRGTVVDANGKPVAKIEVLAVNRDWIDASYYFPRALTDDQGHFDLGPMRPGEYEVHPNINFGGSVPMRSMGGKTSSNMNDNAPIVTIKEGESLNLDPINYDGPPPGPLPRWYEREFPRFPK